LLRDAARLLAARRGIFPAGAAAREQVLKHELLDYDTQVSTSDCVPIEADVIAESSKPDQRIRLVDALPSFWSSFSNSETRLLGNGLNDPEEGMSRISLANVSAAPALSKPSICVETMFYQCFVEGCFRDWSNVFFQSCRDEQQDSSAQNSGNFGMQLLLGKAADISGFGASGCFQFG
jgi:hypothetical protein